MICEQCKEVAGKPQGWTTFPIARPGENVVYIAPNGVKYTSSTKENRPRAALCPKCKNARRPK